MSSNTAHALLVGIDHYPPNTIETQDGELSYRSLRGCVNDVKRMGAYLTEHLGFPSDQVTMLTATSSSDSSPVEPADRQPTKRNIVAAFERLTETADPGDTVYVHYSGHGGRPRTVRPDWLGKAGVDEALVPMDIGDTETDRYIRDFELAALVDRMVQSGLVVTVVLDSCHSGGMTRGRSVPGDAVARGLEAVDVTSRPVTEFAVPEAELEATWQRLMSDSQRGVKLGSGWMPEPEGYVLLAACRPSEVAYESTFEDGVRGGVLTHYLLEVLLQGISNLSYKTLHDRLRPKVHVLFGSQTPQLQGAGDRSVFGSETVRPAYAATVMDIDRANETLELDAGVVHALGSGAQFAVYPPGTTDFADHTRRQAIVELTDLGSTTSTARLIEDIEWAEVDLGAQAMLLSASSPRLVRKVCFVRPEGSREGGLDSTAQHTLESTVAERGNGWLELTADVSDADYRVRVTETGAYEIRDRGGVVENLGPSIPATDPASATKLVSRLVHLARYHAVLELVNGYALSPLDGKLNVTLLGTLPGAAYDPTDPDPEYDAFDSDAAGNVPEIRSGEVLFLEIENRSERDLDVAVLDLQPDWGIEQIYPAGPGDLSVQFHPGMRRVLPLKPYLPEGYERGRDVLKVFATVESTDLRWLELPPLDEPIGESEVRRSRAGPPNALETLFAAVTADENPSVNSRNVAAITVFEEWTTTQVEIDVLASTDDSDDPGN